MRLGRRCGMRGGLVKYWSVPEWCGWDTLVYLLMGHGNDSAELDVQ